MPEEKRVVRLIHPTAELMPVSIDMRAGVIRWRAEHEKTGVERRTPVTEEALGVLEEARKENRRIGDAPLLPHSETPRGA